MYHDCMRVAAVVAGWGAFGALILRAVSFVDGMKRLARWRMEEFRARYGERGAFVLRAYSETDPFGIYDAVAHPDAYLDCADWFLEAWDLPAAHARMGVHGRVFVIVEESFFGCGYDACVYRPRVGDVADKIWWRGMLSA